MIFGSFWDDKWKWKHAGCVLLCWLKPRHGHLCALLASSHSIFAGSDGSLSFACEAACGCLALICFHGEALGEFCCVILDVSDILVPLLDLGALNDMLSLFLG